MVRLRFLCYSSGTNFLNILLNLLIMDWLNLLPEGLRMFRRHIDIRKNGFYRYEGDAEEICRKIVDSCWNKEKEYFMVSGNGNYPYFSGTRFSYKPAYDLGKYA